MATSNDIDENIFNNVLNHIHTKDGAPSWLLQESDFEPAFLKNRPSKVDVLEWLQNCPSRPQEDNHWVRMDVVDGPLSLVMYPKNLPPTQSAWQDAQAISLYYETPPESYLQGFETLCAMVQKTFIQQPFRLFVRGSYAWPGCTELWTFDRSGAYRNTSLEPRAAAMLSQYFSTCLVLSQQELGFSDILRRDAIGEYVILDDLKEQLNFQMYLDKPALVASNEIVGAGLTCYRGKGGPTEDWTYVVKFKWSEQQEQSEIDFLRLAHKRGAKGITILEHDSQIGSTAQYRPQDHRENYSKLSDTGEVTRSSRPFKDLSLNLMVTSPLGRPVMTFKNSMELLNILKDTIATHRSLFCTANIFHQDISPWNIILVDSQDGGLSRGLLIDLDLAVDLENDTRTKNKIIGTAMFMGIGILFGHHHTYRHDLESFLYVLLYLTIGADGSIPRESRLRKWTEGNFWKRAETKSQDMKPTAFEEILTEVRLEHADVKPLARSLHAILFPVREGERWIGTDEEAGPLYDDMLSAFVDALKNIS